MQYKTWSEEKMERAVNSVCHDGVSIRKAAEIYRVPKTTLGDRVSGLVLPGTTCSSMRYLTDEEGNELASFIIGSASICYPKTIKELLVIVQTILFSRGIQ